MAPFGVWQYWWQWVGFGDGGWDEGLSVVRSWWSGGLVYIAGAFEDVVGSWAISSLLEPPGDGLVVFEGVIEACPYSCLY